MSFNFFFLPIYDLDVEAKFSSDWILTLELAVKIEFSLVLEVVSDWEGINVELKGYIYLNLIKKN